jgi:hypothetical protein
MTIENNAGVENPATHEIYMVEYHVVFSTESTERFNGSFEFEGNLPTREQVLSYIAGQNPDADWSGAEKGSYTVSRLMNNDVHITEEQGDFNPAELKSAPTA